MKSINVALLVLVFVLAGVASFQLAVGQSPGNTKSADPDANSRVKPTVLLPNTSANASFAAVAARNEELRTTLTWTFGTKEQHGWYLYTSLIKHTLNTEDSPATPSFATALSHWQQRLGLAATGVLDEETLMAMVVQWQNARIQNREVAAPEELLTAPPSDYFDPERLEELRQVHREAYAAYKRMVAAAIADPSLHLRHNKNGTLAPDENFLKIISSFRSREYQEELRRKSPSAGRAGLAVNSPHFTGRALDLYVGGDPVDTRDANRATQVQTPVYQWLVRNAERFGFRPYFYEPWHWEYVK